MIVFEDVHKSYAPQSDDWALSALSLRIEPGEMVFILGASGAGKTTILKLIALEERPTRGRIAVAEFNSDLIGRGDIPRLRRRCGVVFQDFRLMRDKTVFENVAFGPRVLGLDGKLPVAS